MLDIFIHRQIVGAITQRPQAIASKKVADTSLSVVQNNKQNYYDASISSLSSNQLEVFKKYW